MNIRQRKHTIFILAASALLASVVMIAASRPARAAGPWYVAPGGSDGNTCTSPGTACATINGAIAKASSGDTIYVATGTYTGTGDEVVLLSENATFSGGWNVSFTVQSGTSTIDGEDTRRGITVGDGITAIIDRFTIQNGSSGEGGGITNYHGALTINNSIVRDNVAGGYGGGIANGSTLTLNNSIVSGNTGMSYGGISSFAGTVTLNNSSVTDNAGIGIRNDNGTLTLNSSIVSGNMGSGIFNGDSDSTTLNRSTVSGNTGSGIDNSGGYVTLNNSTVIGNTDSGIYNHRFWHDGTMNLNNCTVTDNTAAEGGGIRNSGGTVTIRNTILTGNTADSGPDCYGAIGSADYNLVGDTSDCSFGAGTSDLVYVDANLGQLIGVSGTPKYHPLLLGSPAIDYIPSGTNGCGTTITVDQRGVSRPQGIACDIGAYEYTAPGPAASISAIGGTPQRAVSLNPLETPLQTAVLDNIGSPVNVVTVTFSAPASGASGIFTDTGTFTTTAMTNGSGVATAATFVANELVGSYVVTATVGGVVTPANFLLDNVLWWYVTPDGNDDNPCTSVDAACATINGVLEKASFVAGDTVLVATGTYTGTGDEVVLLDKNATLSGGWDDAFTTQSGTSTIDGEGLRRGIKVYGAETAIIEYFTVQNGFADWPRGGGGISNYSTLTTTNCIITGNRADTDGGGIYNYGTLILNNSTVSGNISSADGGGIYNNDGTLTLNNSTISGNTADSGGGISKYDGLVILNSSTVSANTARSTGGGIAGDATLKNTILDGNSAGIFGPDCDSTIASSGYNLVGNTSGCAFASSTGDLINVDADLAQLIGDSEVPKYHPLLPSSPAIDAGNPAGCTDHLDEPLDTDQRGTARVGRCDIGAYEYTIPGPAASIYAFGGTPQRTPPFSAFETSLQAVVLDSIGSPVNNTTVKFSAPSSGPSGTFADSGTFTTTAVTDGGGIATAAAFTANGLEGSYTVTATTGGIATTANFLLTNGGWYVAPHGDDMNDCQTPTTPCATVNGALGKAGFLAGDTVLVATGTYTGTGNNAVLLDKSVRLLGGWNDTFITQAGTSTINGEGSRRGISVNSGVTAIIEHFVVQNGSSGGGSGISNDGTLTLDNSTVSDNTANDDGGGIFNGGTLDLNNSTVNGNTGDSGGGIFNAGTLTLNNSTVSDNAAGWRGGGIYNPGTLTLDDSTVSGNTSGYGGGILNHGTLTLNNSTVDGNDGNGITNYGGNATLSRSTVRGNTGGGIHNSGNGTMALNNSTVSDNTVVSGSSGGGIHNSYSTLILNNSTISGNEATTGGGLYNSGAAATLQNTIVAGNTASGTGPDCSGPIGSSGYNLVGDTSGCTFTPTTGDLTNVNAQLGPLEGSPAYHPLTSGSPAINAGDPAGCTDRFGNPLITDQRGMPRPGRCDIGAYEVSLKAEKQMVGTFTPGTATAFMIQLHNEADSDITGIHVTDVLPTSLIYVPGSFSVSNGMGGEDDGVITWTGSIPADDSVVIGFQATVSDSAPSCSLITNKATIRGEGYEFERQFTGLVPCVCKTTKGPSNPVLSVGADGSWDDAGVWSPTVLKKDGAYKMWYTGGDGSNPSQIGLATSIDGIAWTKEAANPVLSPSAAWETGGIAAGSVISDSGLYKMWYTGYDSGGIGRIGYATSPDGITWAKHGGNPVLDVGIAGGWEDDDVTKPTVIKEGSTYHMWYTGDDGATPRIGHATSSDGVNWTKDPANPILDVGSPGDWDWLYVYGPSVVTYNDVHLLWYSGGTLPPTWQTGYALSTDDSDWTQRQMLIPEGAPGTFDANGADYPSVVVDNGEFKTWYSGLNSGGTYNIGYASTEICGASTEHSNPIYLPLTMKDWSLCPAYYTDDFSDPGSGWPVHDDSNVRFAYTGGQYQMWVKKPAQGWLLTPGAKATDFVVEVRARRTSGNYGVYGIIFGLNEDWSQRYQVHIDANYYSIWRYRNGNWTALRNWTSSGHIKTGTNWNHLKVVRNGASIALYVNGHYLTTVTDGSLTGLRRIGLLAYSPYNGPLDARFDDFSLSPVSCDGGAAAASTRDAEGATAPGFEMGIPEVYAADAPPASPRPPRRHRGKDIEWR